jgi:hypothetical protein
VREKVEKGRKQNDRGQPAKGEKIKRGIYNEKGLDIRRVLDYKFQHQCFVCESRGDKVERKLSVDKRS